MHVEVSSDPGKVPKHAGQKKTYKAIAETYAFLPREAVTRFLMSCGECQKRMHISTTGQDCKENDRPSSRVSEVIDYNMPLTTTYMKRLKLQSMSVTKVRELQLCLCLCAGRAEEQSPRGDLQSSSASLHSLSDRLVKTSNL
uniref:Nucleolar protein 4-like b n=1 Tax=Amphilophus citrinellus TaxID=61819 RepID=A0A3Q0RHC9_AMPCI